jgi:UDP-N-acetylglucosamine pyrophosphorylase
LELIKDTCFVLVAGGLGERLGFDGIKVSIPIGNHILFTEIYMLLINNNLLNMNLFTIYK